MGRFPTSHARLIEHQMLGLRHRLGKNVHRARAFLVSDPDPWKAANPHLDRESVVTLYDAAPALSKAAHDQMLSLGIGGKGGTRTLEGALHPLPAQPAGAFHHSAASPGSRDPPSSLSAATSPHPYP